MELWWGTLSEAMRWFYAIAITTSVLMVFQLLLMIFGMDGEMEDGGDGDAGVDGDVRVLSVRTVTAFFAGFGWTGVASLENGSSLLTALLLAILVGGVFMGGVIVLMKALYGMRHSGTIDYHNAIGEIATVYLRIPGGMDHPGQVEVMVQGRLKVAQAFTRSSEEIPNQARVRVVDVMDQNTLIVEPLSTVGPAETEEE
jgi:hypothetical protein